MSHDDGIENRLLVEGELVLAENRHSMSRGDDDFALVRFNLSGEDFEESRFAGAVGANEPIAVPRGEFYVDAFEYYPFAIRKGYVRGTDHSRLLPAENKKNHRHCPWLTYYPHILNLNAEIGKRI